MKGGLAVMLDLATTVREPAVDVTWCFYAREEIGRAESGLLQLWKERPDLLAGDAAILGEPTGAAGGGRLSGDDAGAHHAAGGAGPYGTAVHRAQRHPPAGAPAQRVADWGGREVVLDGCTYAEQLQAVAVEGGVAANVVPDEARLVLNHRYAPDRRRAEAEAFLHELLQDLGAGDGDTWEVLDAGDGAPPSLGHPLLAALVEKSGAAPRRRSAGPTWPRSGSTGCRPPTSGPGDPLLAHHPDERVTAAQLEQARRVLAALTSPDDDRPHHVLVDVADVVVGPRLVGRRERLGLVLR